MQFFPNLQETNTIKLIFIYIMMKYKSLTQKCHYYTDTPEIICIVITIILLIQ